MKRTSIIVKALLCVALIALAGCSAIQSKINADLQTATVPDLKAAVASAQAANDADGVACWSELLKYVESLPTASPDSQPMIAGAASALEAARIARLQGPVSLPPVPHSLHVACAVLQVDAQQTIAKLGLKIGLAAAPIAGSLKVQAGANALKAEAAALKAGQ